MTTVRRHTMIVLNACSMLLFFSVAAVQGAAAVTPDSSSAPTMDYGIVSHQVSDSALAKVQGRGMAVSLSLPNPFPGVILWDEPKSNGKRIGATQPSLVNGIGNLQSSTLSITHK